MLQDSSIIHSFTTHLKSALIKAVDFAGEFGHKNVTCAHLLYGLASEKGGLAAEILSKADFPLDLLKQELIRQHRKPVLSEPSLPELDETNINIITKAIRTAQLHGHTYIGTEHALACLLDLMDDRLKNLLQAWKIDTNSMQRQILIVLKSTSKFPDLTETLHHLHLSQEEIQDDLPESDFLETIGKDITNSQHLNTCPPLIGREQEIDRIQQILCRRYKNNPLLVGKPGVGKTAIVEGFAKNILDKKTHPKLYDKRIYSIELSSLVAGTMYRGEFEQKIKALLYELRENPEIILFIDEIHTLIGAGSSGQPLDAANMLKPALARGEIRCIGATTWEEYQQHILKDQAFARRFQIIPINEPNDLETKRILEGIKKTFENYHQVSITDQAIDASLELSNRYLSHTCQPDKAIDLIDEASARRITSSSIDTTEKEKQKIKQKIKRLQKQKSLLLNTDEYKKAITINNHLNKLLRSLDNLSKNKTKKLQITDKHIQQAVSVRTGIDANRLSYSAKPIANKLFIQLNNQIIGQEDALNKISSAVQRGCSPLKEQNKPLGAYIFLGPSGVGKTTTAKALAKTLFSDEHALIRLDMSEFSEKFTLSKLIGAPAGYVGYQESGQLTNAVKQRPLSIVLFDEIEKAHPDIFNILMQILDEGYLRDGQGNLVDFRQTMIILTSNLGLKELQNQVGFTQDISNKQLQAEINSAVKNFFRQELLNRFDDIIHFQPLGISQRQAIIKQKVNNLNQRLADRAKIILSDEVIEYYSETAYIKEQGVRSLEKIIRETIEIPLSQSLWKYKKGEKINIRMQGDKISIN